jgi:hypothetical protein
VTFAKAFAASATRRLPFATWLEAAMHLDATRDACVEERHFDGLAYGVSNFGRGFLLFNANDFTRTDIELAPKS